MNCKRIAALLLAFALLLYGSAFAATEWSAKITSNSKVYSSASKDSKVLGSVKSGTSLSLIATKNGWAKVKMNGKTGYVAASSVKKASRVMYVKSSYVYVFSKATSGSSKLATLGYGTPVSVEAINGSWARVINGSKTGYCSLSSLTGTNVNKYNKTVYVQSDNVEVRSLPIGSGSVIAKLNKNTGVTLVAVYGDEWCRVKYKGKYAYIKKDKLGTSKVNVYSTAKPVSGKAVEADWWKSDIQSVFARGTTAVVTDVATGISWKVYRGGGTNHADVQPSTAADTAAMKKACGSDYNTWARRAIWVSVGGKKYAASMNCMPHGDGSIKNNNFNGHYCIHFTNSRTHGTNSVCQLHQSAIKKALKAG